jgi:hypothetical protein
MGLESRLDPRDPSHFCFCGEDATPDANAKELELALAPVGLARHHRHRTKN